MALIKCPECDKEISDKATCCPNCGNPLIIDNNEKIQQKNHKKLIVLISLLVVVAILSIVMIIMGVFSNEEKPDAISQKMKDDINTIGEVTLDDEELINNLFDTYASLTEKQKNNVDNYNVLLESQDKLRELQKEQLNEVHMKNIIIATKSLKSSLINPDSFSLREVVYVDDYEYDGIMYRISYSGENKLGGSTGSVVYVAFDKNGEYGITDESDDDYAQVGLGMQAIIDGEREDEKRWGSPVYMDTDFIIKHIDD